MKKIVISLAVVLAAADGVALWVYLQHKKTSSAPPAAAAPPEPAPAPGPAEPQPLPSNAMVRPAEPSYGGDNAVTPGGCHSPAECDAYCADAAHRQECLDFIGPGAAAPAAAAAPDAGAAAAEPAAGAHQDPNRDQPGPGGCRGREECEAYCSNASRREECADFAAEARKRMAAGARRAGKSQQACLKKSLGSARFAALLKGRLDPDGSTDEAMTRCMSGGNRGPKRDPKKGMDAVEGAPAGCTDMASCTEVCMKPENCSACLAWNGLPEQFRSMLNCGGE
ncbi:MAG: hypothetical protein HY928_18605 [Elusimicrobia bacterium]|nr:hypothetical protein [Elusimicrobiota bacterium]